MKVETDGDSSWVTTITITVGARVRRYAVDGSRDWASQIVQDGRAGLFGPPTASWDKPDPLPWPNEDARIP